MTQIADKSKVFKIETFAMGICDELTMLTTLPQHLNKPQLMLQFWSKGSSCGNYMPRCVRGYTGFGLVALWLPHPQTNAENFMKL